MGRHRLGIKARGIDVGRVHRVLIWLQAESAVNLYLDLRDDLGARSGKASFKLHHAAAYYADPDIVAFGVSPAANGWTRVWADMKFAGEAVVVYLSLANSRGNTEFAGIGTTGMIFGGIDIAKRELTPP
jgi:hypothetical protein